MPLACAGVDACLTAQKDRVNATCVAEQERADGPDFCVRGSSGALCLHCEARDSVVLSQ